MSGARSEEHAANKKAVIDYNGTGSHRVSDKSVSKEKSYSDTYGPIGGATGEGHKKRKKMKGLWLLIFLILALSGFLTYLLLRGDKSAPQIANEVTVDSTEASYQKRIEQEKRIQKQEAKQRSQKVVEPEPVNEEPAKKIEYAPNGEPLLEMPEFPEDGNFTPEWLERKKKWDEQQLRILEWKEQHGPNSVYIEYKESSFEELVASNYRLRRYRRTDSEYM